MSYLYVMRLIKMILISDLEIAWIKQSYLCFKMFSWRSRTRMIISLPRHLLYRLQFIPWTSQFASVLVTSMTCFPYIAHIFIADYFWYVIPKSLRDFRPLRYSSRDGHAEGEPVNRGRDIPSFCPNLQLLDMSILGDVADVNPVIKFLPHTVNHVA
jgi:hypothetical protein